MVFQTVCRCLGILQAGILAIAGAGVFHRQNVTFVQAARQPTDQMVEHKLVVTPLDRPMRLVQAKRLLGANARYEKGLAERVGGLGFKRFGREIAPIRAAIFRLM